MYQLIEKQLYSFLVVVFAVSLFASPSVQAGDIQCRAKVPPRINVRPSKSNIKYDFTKTKVELTNRDVDTVSPYGPHHETNVSGLMSGSIQLKSNVSFMHETHPYLGRGCVFLKAVNVDIHIDPTIYIARELPKGGCMHNAVLAHEFKHIEVDRLIVNKYTNIIGQALSDVIDRRGSTYGPMKKIRMNEIQMDVKEELHNVVRRMNEHLNKERRKKQQHIDNLEEYASIGQRCKSQHKRGRR